MLVPGRVFPIEIVPFLGDMLRCRGCTTNIDSQTFQKLIVPLAKIPGPKEEAHLNVLHSGKLT